MRTCAAPWELDKLYSSEVICQEKNLSLIVQPPCIISVSCSIAEWARKSTIALRDFTLKREGKTLSRTNGNWPPAYQRIQGTIRERIEKGHLKPGDAVDSERELAKIHRVSLMTARHALAELQREGLVERRRGAGTFVAPPKIHFNKLTSLSEEMASRGLSARSRLLGTSV